MINKIFLSVPDYCMTRRCTYPLSELPTIALLNYMCRGEGYVDMSEFAHTRARSFGLLGDCGKCSPSPDRFERLMSAVHPDEIERCLREYDRRFLEGLRAKQAILDGKKLRGASPWTSRTKGDYLLNVYVSEAGLTIGQEGLTDKEKENENRLHWCLDVVFREDAARARKGYAPQNLSCVRKLALQLIRNHSDRRSLRKRLCRSALSQEYLLEILNNANF